MMAGFGVSRAAEALLHGVGGRTVLLRMPLPAVAGDLGEQVGLAQPQFQDTALGPVVFRRVRAKIGVGEAHVRAADYELLVSAVAVERVVGTLAYDSASVLFQQALGVLVDGDLLTITQAVSTQAFGVVLMWRVALQGAVRLAV